MMLLFLRTGVNGWCRRKEAARREPVPPRFDRCLLILPPITDRLYIPPARLGVVDKPSLTARPAVASTAASSSATANIIAANCSSSSCRNLPGRYTSGTGFFSLCFQITNEKRN
jgi:hypothetical protein